jgi:hypothetical protein
MNTKTVELQVI